LPDDAFLPQRVLAHTGYRANPWTIDARTLEGDVAIIGSGLTAMDAVAQLEVARTRRRVYLLSRHGFLPALENPAISALEGSEVEIDATSPRSLVRSMRNAVRTHDAAGRDWRAVLESIRAITPEIWQNWTERERRSFLRHAQPAWIAHRYRVPPPTHAAYLRMIERGQLSVLVGRITGAHVKDERTLGLTIGCDGRTTGIEAGSLINATGPSSDYGRLRDPLVRAARRRGLIRPDALRLGLDVTKDLQCVDRAGRANRALFTLGAPARGRFYEGTAIPEIRAHAAVIARTIRDREAYGALEAEIRELRLIAEAEEAGILFKHRRPDGNTVYLTTVKPELFAGDVPLSGRTATRKERSSSHRPTSGCSAPPAPQAPPPQNCPP